jgi:hypothetical protein
MNKHGLCGYCQTELGKGERLTKWIAGGKKQEKAYRKRRHKTLTEALRQPDLEKYTSQELIDELERRKAEAKALLKFLG